MEGHGGQQATVISRLVGGMRSPGGGKGWCCAGGAATARFSAAHPNCSEGARPQHLGATMTRLCEAPGARRGATN